MATLQEIMAAKAAAKKASTVAAPSVLPVDSNGTKPTEPQPESNPPIKEDKPVASQEEKSEAKVEEVAIVQPPKPLSFAEKMALKKQEQQKTAEIAIASAKAVENATAVTTVNPAKTESPTNTTGNGVVITPEDHAEVIKATLPAIQQQELEQIPIEDQQAYADIKAKVDSLTTLEGEGLENAMSDLKKALMKNPNAVNLMQDQDIGQMVIALRKITGEAIAEAAKDGRKTKVKASKVAVDLTDPAVVANIMDQL